MFANNADDDTRRRAILDALGAAASGIREQRRFTYDGQEWTATLVSPLDMRADPWATTYVCFQSARTVTFRTMTTGAFVRATEEDLRRELRSAAPVSSMQRSNANDDLRLDPETLLVLIDHARWNEQHEWADELKQRLPPSHQARLDDDKSRESYRQHFREAGLWAGVLAVGWVLKVTTGIDNVLVALAVFLGCATVSTLWFGGESLGIAIGTGIKATALILAALAVPVVAFIGLLLLLSSC